MLHSITSTVSLIDTNLLLYHAGVCSLTKITIPYNSEATRWPLITVKITVNNDRKFFVRTVGSRKDTNTITPIAKVLGICITELPRGTVTSSSSACVSRFESIL